MEDILYSKFQSHQDDGRVTIKPLVTCIVFLKIIENFLQSENQVI